MSIDVKDLTNFLRRYYEVHKKEIKDSKFVDDRINNFVIEVLSLILKNTEDSILVLENLRYLTNKEKKALIYEALIRERIIKAKVRLNIPFDLFLKLVEALPFNSLDIKKRKSLENRIKDIFNAVSIEEKEIILSYVQKEKVVEKVMEEIKNFEEGFEKNDYKIERMNLEEYPLISNTSFYRLIAKEYEDYFLNTQETIIENFAEILSVRGNTILEKSYYIMQTIKKEIETEKINDKINELIECNVLFNVERYFDKERYEEVKRRIGLLEYRFSKNIG